MKVTVVRNSLAKKTFEGGKLKPLAEFFSGIDRFAYGGASIIELTREVVELTRHAQVELRAAMLDDTIFKSKAGVTGSRSSRPGRAIGQIVAAGHQPCEEGRRPDPRPRPQRRRPGQGDRSQSSKGRGHREGWIKKPRQQRPEEDHPAGHRAPRFFFCHLHHECVAAVRLDAWNIRQAWSSRRPASGCGVDCRFALVLKRDRGAAIDPVFEDPAPGIDAAYHPMQGAGLVENGKLPYVEVPLIFWLDAALARVLMASRGMNTDDAVLLSSRIVDGWRSRLPRSCSCSSSTPSPNRCWLVCGRVASPASRPPGFRSRWLPRRWSHAQPPCSARRFSE